MLDVREPLLPQAPRDLRARTRGRTGPHSQSPVRPRIPRPPSSTACSGRGILEPGERFGANRSATRKAADEYGSAPGVTFIKGTVIELDPAGHGGLPDLGMIVRWRPPTTEKGTQIMVSAAARHSSI